MAIAVAACSGGSGSAGATAPLGGPGGGARTGSSGATQVATGTTAGAKAALPFADTCDALKAADFTPLGLTLTKANHGLSNVAEICFFQVQAGDGTTASPTVEFFTAADFEAGRQVYNKPTFKYKAVSGIGDDAYTFTTLSPVLYVKAKGLAFNVTAVGLGGSVGSGDPEADIEALAKAIVGRL
jgi:hypothetical protein